MGEVFSIFRRISSKPYPITDVLIHMDTFNLFKRLKLPYLQQILQVEPLRRPPHPTMTSQAAWFPDDKVPLEGLVASPATSPEVHLSSPSPPAVARLPQVQTSSSPSSPKVVDSHFPKATAPCYFCVRITCNYASESPLHSFAEANSTEGWTAYATSGRSWFHDPCLPSSGLFEAPESTLSQQKLIWI